MSEPTLTPENSSCNHSPFHVPKPPDTSVSFEFTLRYIVTDLAPLCGNSQTLLIAPSVWLSSFTALRLEPSRTTSPSLEGVEGVEGVFVVVVVTTEGLFCVVVTAGVDGPEGVLPL